MLDGWLAAYPESRQISAKMAVFQPLSLSHLLVPDGQAVTVAACQTGLD